MYTSEPSEWVNLFSKKDVQKYEYKMSSLIHYHLYTVWIRVNVVFDFAEPRNGANVCSSVRADQSPPAHLLEPLGALLAVRRAQLAGRAAVVGQQREERAESPVAAAQAEEQVAQLHANAGRPVVALVAQREENIGLAAVPAATQRRNGG